jgi:hypothetical protein
MKKILIGGLIAVVLLLVVGLVAGHLFLDRAVKHGIETVGPMVTKVDVRLDGVNVSVLSGSGKIKGLVVGNPEGFKSPSAIKVGSASLAIQPSSVLSDKIIIRSVDVQAPEITFETDLRKNNLSKLLENVESATGQTGADSQPPAQEQNQTRLQVDDFRVTGGKINVSLTMLGGKSVTVPLPDIHLTGLGQGPEGVTGAELTKRVLSELTRVAIPAAMDAAKELAKGAGDIIEGVGKESLEGVRKTTKGITDLFKKKE